MLSDYHVHLRPDSRDATPEKYFTTENADRYRTVAGERGITELGVAEHIYRFTEALEVWDHTYWLENAKDDLSEYREFVRSTDLRLGIEADYIPGREDQMANLLGRHEFDYIVGSVHFLGEGAVDHDRFDVWSFDGDPDRLWERYFQTLAELIRTGLYDILAHPDLIKYWGDRRPKPTRDPRFYYEPALEALADSKMAVEVSTAGYRKPIGELYPADDFAAAVIEIGCPFALSSDAHVPNDLGYGYERAVERMRGWGVEEIAVFENRELRLEPLG